MWKWLSDNKDSITALCALLGAAGVLFAAGSLFISALNLRKTKLLNTANAVFQTMKEARDLALKLDTTKSPDISQTPRVVRDSSLFAKLHFSASVYYYRLFRVIDNDTWITYKMDLYYLLRDPEIDSWVDGHHHPNLPSVDSFHPRFIDYLKKIRSERDKSQSARVFSATGSNRDGNYPQLAKGVPDARRS